jgi:hypothetical protein
MASVSETGHNKNVANFASAIQVLVEMGSLYNPTNPNLLLANLNPVKTNLGGTITFLNNKKPIYKNAVADREILIAELPSRLTMSLNYAKSTNISQTDKENLSSQVKKMRGDKKAKVVNPETAEGDSISTSQMSYDSRIANFDTYISQLSSLAEYNPNETVIQIADFQDYHQKLTNSSTLVNSAGNELITGRKNRNNILYNDQINVIQLMRDIKAYLKSLGSAAEPYYKAIVKLQFKDIKN